MEIQQPLKLIFQFINVFGLDNAPGQGIGKTGTREGCQFFLQIFRLAVLPAIKAKAALAGVGNGSGQIGLANFTGQGSKGVINNIA